MKYESGILYALKKLKYNKHRTNMLDSAMYICIKILFKNEQHGFVLVNKCLTTQKINHVSVKKIY